MMKKNCLILLVILAFASCKKEADPIEFTTISGTITNMNTNTISIENQRYSKTLQLDASGKFKDTLQIEDGVFVLKNGADNIVLELKSGYDLDISYDANKLIETLNFSGLGAVNNNYFADRNRLDASSDLRDLNAYYTLDKPAFDRKLANTKRTLENLLSDTPGLDSVIVKSEQRSNQQFMVFLQRSYPQKHLLLSSLPKGVKSPSFSYPDIHGKKVSLKDLKGNYVYIDVWATWCGPCKVQIPYLKDIEEKYKDKNIEFIGISIDTQENKGKWESMVKQRDLKGHQLLADNDWKSTFVMEYFISGIPRFILIDPNGNIVSPDAPRPSDPALIKLFNELNI